MLHRAWILWASLLICIPLAACGGGGETTATSSGTSQGTGGGTTGTGGGDPSTCGNSDIEPPETCDDGNTDSNDGCNEKCHPEVGFTCKGTPSVCKSTCGDGAVASDEACDDGNIVGGDGCSPSCAIEDGFTCDEMPSKCAAICGDGLVKGDETCDDSNAKDGDGCSATCATEPGYECTGAPSVCVSDCGDGVKAGAEGCDDGNTKNADGCSASCEVEPGFNCVGSPSVCTTGCGDGIKAGAEACDDGDMQDGDGCSKTCTIEAGFTCMGSPSVCTPICGDSMIFAPETCDDGNANGGDGCSATCMTEPGFTCDGVPSVCVGSCGDGVVTGAEACDDGNKVNGDGCTSDCAVQMGFSCVGSPSVCTPLCGDGAKLGAEACDDANSNAGDGCSPTCMIEPGFTCVGIPSVCSPLCGDGVKTAAEPCDDGNADDTDCCTSACQLLCEVEPNNTSAEALMGGTFDDGLVIKAAITPIGDVDYFAINVTTYSDLLIETFSAAGPNTCIGVDTVMDLIAPNGMTVLASNDDVSGENACSRIDPGKLPGARGLAPGVYYAKITPFAAMSTIDAYTIRFTFVAVCGDGIVEGSEECDGPAGPPCDVACQRIPVCGDGFTDAPETCDDANMVNADGCTSCSINVGYLCAGVPSACIPICGDNMLIGAEQCDDGNAAVGDGCDTACRTEVLINEIENNNTPAQADAQPININGPSTVVSGAIGVINDRDLFKLTIAANTVVRLETFGPSGNDCPVGVSTGIRLLNPMGVEIFGDFIKGMNSCSALEVYLPVGAYYAQVEKSGNNGVIAAYKLQVKIQTSKGSELEPNGNTKIANTFVGYDVSIFGAHPNQAEVDFYVIAVPEGRSVRAEVIEGAAETCESLGIDTYLELYDEGANLIATDDDGGRGFCSAIDGTGAMPFYPTAHALASGQYYLAVRASPFAAGADALFDYRIAVTVR